MKFCSNCNSKLFQSIDGFKCKRCDDYNPDEKKTVLQKSVYSENKTFPYVINKYYIQKEIRDRFGLPPITGINPNKGFRMIILFRNAHTANQTNVYLDRYDEETEIYRYVGRGPVGDQTLEGNNKVLKDAKNRGYAIHLFWQQNTNSDHQYIGEVTVEDIILEKQSDKTGKIRYVYVFLLKSKN